MSQFMSRKFVRLLSGFFAIALVVMLLVFYPGTTADAALNPTVQTAIAGDPSITPSSVGINLSNNPNIYGEVDVSELTALYPGLAYLNLSGTNVTGVINEGTVSVIKTDTFADPNTVTRRQFVVTGTGLAYRESAPADLSVADLINQVQIKCADGSYISIPPDMLESGSVTISGVTYNVTPTGTVAKAAVLSNAAGVYSAQLSFPIANSSAVFNQNVNLSVRKSGYTLTTTSGATSASVYDGGTVDIVLKKTNEDGAQTTLGAVSDYYFNLYVNANHNLTTDIDRSSDGMQITIKVKAADIGSTSADLQVFEDSGMSNMLADIHITKYSNEDVSSFVFEEYAYISNAYTAVGTIAGGGKIYVAGGTSISSETASNLTSYTASTMYLLKGTYASSGQTGYIPARYESQISAAIGTGYDLECELVAVNDPGGGGQVLALIVKAKTASAISYTYDTVNSSTKPVTVTLNNAGSVGTIDAYLDVQVTGNTALGYMIYQVPSIYANYSKTQIEDAVNNGDQNVALVSQYGFNASNEWTEIVNNGAAIVEDSTLYLIALAYYEDGGQLFIIPDSQINGWYYDQVDMNNMFDSSTQGTPFGGTSMDAWDATTSFSSNTVVLAVHTDVYESSVSPEIAANLIFAPNNAANNVPVTVIKEKAEVIQYIIVPDGFAFPLGGANAYEELRLETAAYSATNTAGDLYRLNVLGEDAVTIGDTNTYYIAAVYSNYKVSDNYAAASVAGGVRLDNWTSPAKPAEVNESLLGFNYFDVKATGSAGGLDALAGTTFDITYGEGAVSSKTVTITVGKSTVNGIYLVYEDYFGNYYSAAPAVYESFADIEKLDFNFEIPQGTQANVYAVYSFTNEQYYAGAADWKDYLVPVNDWSLAGTANLTAGAADYTGNRYPVTGTAMAAGDSITATPGFAPGGQVTLGADTYIISAAGPVATDIDVVAPLITGIIAYDNAPVPGPVAGGAVLSGAGYYVGDSFDTNPDVDLTDGTAGTSLAGLTAGTGYTGAVTMKANPAANAEVNVYGLKLKAGGTVTVSYSYVYTINGRTETVTINENASTPAAYTFDIDTAKATVEEVFLVAKNSSQGTLVYQGGGVYTVPYSLGSTIDVYPVAMNSLVKLDSSYPAFAALTHISDSAVAANSGYFGYIKAADVNLDQGGATWSFTGPQGAISATLKTDANGYLYYEVLFTDEIYSAQRLEIEFDPATITLNASAPYSAVAAGATAADIEVYHLVDAATAFVVDVKAVENGAGPYTAGSAVEFDAEYYISTSSSANPGSGYRVSPSNYFFNGSDITAISNQSGNTAPNMLHVDEISVPAANSYTLTTSGDTLKFVPTVAGTYKFALYTYNRAGVIAPYYSPQYFEISFTVDPQTASQNIYYGQAEAINVLGSISGWADITEDGTNALDAAALSKGVLKMAGNTDATVYVDVKDGNGIALARITVNACSATAQSAALSLSSSAGLPHNMANGESMALYWNVSYLASDGTTYTLAENADSASWTSVFAEYGNALTLSNSLMTAVGGSASGVTAYDTVYDAGGSSPASGTSAQVWVRIDTSTTVTYNYVISDSDTVMNPVVTVNMQPGDTKTLYVWDADTNSLISGIDLAGSSDNVVAQASVNGSAATAASIDVSALADGNAAVTVYPASGGFVSVDVAVSTTSPATYTLSGQVTDGTTGLSGVTVNVSGHQGVTDAGGNYSISGIPAGTYTISITEAGYAPYSTGITVSGDMTQDITLTPAASVHNITGDVTDGTNPVNGAAVTLTDSLGGIVDVVYTGAAGDFVITGIPNGTYTLNVSCSGFAPASQSVTVANADAAAGTVVLSASTTHYDVTGTVVNATAGTPVAGAYVTLENGGGAYYAMTGASGAFTVTGVPDGNYTATVSAPGYAERTAAVTVNGQNEALGTIEITALYEITGSVTGSGGGAVANASVTITGGTNGYTATVTTDASGSYRFTNVPDGDTYSIAVTASGYNSGSGSVTVNGADAAAGSIALTASGGVTPPIGGGGTVTNYNVTVNAGKGGSASSDKAAAASGTTVTITVTPEDGYVLDTITAKDADGNAVAVSGSAAGYTFTMPAKNVTVTVSFKQDGGGHSCPSAPYTDVDTSRWYHEYVDYVIEKGIMEGTSSTTFEPDSNVTRGMMVQLFYNIEGRPAVSGSTAFDDVAAGDWYHDAVVWAYANGVVEGYDKQTFGPKDSVTREQMVAMLYRYANYKGYDTGAKGSLSGYPDAGSVSGYAVEAMRWAVGAGMIEGRGGTHLAPDGTSIRAEVATIITRYCRAYDIF